MRKLSLIVAGLLASTSCFAELGQINVKSYLNQPLYATIPVYNVAGGDYANLSINLATSDKYKSYGVNYDSELGLLLFKVINQGGSHYLQITSTQSIKSPVLNVLLHYQENNNDFYRQYTVLLNPIALNGNLPSSVVNNKPTVNPIGIYGKNDITKQTNKRQIQAMNLNAGYVKAHLTQFNKENNTFTMKAGDSLYVPTKFVQELYSKLYFPINQVALALALANYHNLRDKNYVYESDFVINLPTPQQISSLPIKDVDEYIWSSNNNVEHNIAALANLANKFDRSIEINGDADVFASGEVIKNASKSSASQTDKSLASDSVKTPSKYVPPVYSEPNIIDDILDYKIEIAAGLLALVGILLLVRKRSKALSDNSADNQLIKPKQSLSKAKKLSSELVQEETVEKINFTSSVLDNTIKEYAPVQPDLVATPVDNSIVTTNAPLNFATAVEMVHKDQQPAFELTYPDSPSPYGVSNIGTNYDEKDELDNTTSDNSIVTKSANHDEVIYALEQILTIDSSRNDIRLKLFELYLDAGLKTKAHHVYNELKLSNDFDLNFAESLNALIHKYSFTGESQVTHSAELSNIVENLPPTDMVTMPETDVASTPAEEDELEPIIEQNQLDDTILNLAVLPATDDSRTLEFNLVDNHVASIAVENTESKLETVTAEEVELSVEQRINLAKMYYHIDEQQLAKNMLKAIILDPTTSYEQKETAMKLISEYQS